MTRSNGYTANQVIEALKETKGMVYLAAEALGCAPQTVYNYAKRYKSVQVEIDNQRGVFLDKTEMKLDEAIEKGESWAIAFALKTLGKKRGYTEKQEIEQRTTNIEIDLNTLTDDQIKRLAAGEDIAAILADG
jgi:hypothetical protein